MAERLLRDGARLALGTLTAVRVAPPSRIDRRVAAVAMVLAPVAGLVPAGTAAAVVLAGDVLGVSWLLTAALAVAGAALTSRGLHLDGLADTADGLAASYDRDRALAVMRTSDTGPAGAATLVLVLIVQVAALASAAERFGPVAALVALTIGRLALPVACLRGLPAARPEGLGATVAGTVTPVAAAATTVLVGLAAVGFLGPAGAGATATGLAAAGALLLRARHRFGGITGDILGAAVEAATTGAVIALAVAAPLG